LGTKADELREQELDFDFKSFKEMVFKYENSGGKMSVKEIAQQLIDSKMVYKSN